MCVHVCVHMHMLAQLGLSCVALLPSALPRPVCRSTPPYMVVNRCRDVFVRLSQAGVQFSKRKGVARVAVNAEWQGWDEVPPNARAPMPFAWDEPMGEHTVLAIAHVAGMEQSQLRRQVGCPLPMCASARGKLRPSLASAC